MELKEYQRRTLEAFDRWRKALDAARGDAETRARALEGAGVDVSDADRDFPRKAWERLAERGEIAASAGPYVARRDGAGRPIPHVCFKIPTGGGKTLLGAGALERLGMQTGLVLWIVPTRAIYAQTKAAFWNREHPYRQMLERASGGRVKLIEKETPFTRQDIANYLCVMLLMLPAARRQKGKEFLRMFRDSGRYPTLFPASDDKRASDALLDDHPDLERSEEGMVKHSLFNAFKRLRPVVVLDEAHKAYGGKGATEFVASVNRLNPRLVIELSATPSPKVSNLLVDISGVDLKKEAMIKLPVEITSDDTADWRNTLARAHDKLTELDAEARSLDASEGRYIRPIAVVRVERTGKDQRSHDRIHAEDVREHLTRRLGVAPEAVRVKSGEKDEIAGEDLLSEYSTVRWIITKAALMEGWDCSFAYLLVMLDNTRSQTAITQLIGRVMRQPHARRTDRDALDRCYVHCWQTDVGAAVKQVKSGLEKEGLTGLGDDVFSVDASDLKMRTIQRRARFRNRDIFLPKVLHADADGGWRELDYQRHILSAIDWDSIDAPSQPALPSASDGPASETIEFDLDDSYRPSVTREALEVDTTVTLDWFTRQLTDLVPNPWQAARIVGELIEKLRGSGLNDAAIYQQRRFQISQLREHVAARIEQRAEGVFREKLRRHEMRFNLEAGEPNFRMYDSYNLAVGDDEPPLTYKQQPVQRSLFDRVLDRQFDSDLERRFAFYLDEQEAIQWWHRIAVRQQYEYYLRGWKEDRIWPDFVAMSRSGERAKILVVETKGKHLDNPDTDYKEKVFDALESWLNKGQAYECGTVEVEGSPVSGKFTIVFKEEGFPLAAP